MKWQRSDLVPSRITPLMQGSPDRLLTPPRRCRTTTLWTQSRPSPKPPATEPSMPTSKYAYLLCEFRATPRQPSAGLYGKPPRTPPYNKHFTDRVYACIRTIKILSIKTNTLALMRKFDFLSIIYIVIH